MSAASRRMRAARITGPQQATVEEVPLPEPRERQVRFRVEGSGVCASNLGPWFGLPWTQYPLLPGESGHEAWGIVDAIGSPECRLREGDRVAAISYSAYAEFDVADENALVRLPPSLGSGPFPGEALGCVMNIFERARISPGQDVAVVGVGFLGALLTRLASAAGARVIAVSKRTESLDLALELGATDVIPFGDLPAALRHVDELTGGRRCDRVIEATGKQAPLDLAAEFTKTRGTLVIAGYHQDGPRSVNMQLWNYRGLDVINAHEREIERYAHGIRAAVGAVLLDRIAPERLYTHVFGLDGLGAALHATAERPPGFIKALVCP